MFPCNITASRTFFCFGFWNLILFGTNFDVMCDVVHVMCLILMCDFVWYVTSIRCRFIDMN